MALIDVLPDRPLRFEEFQDLQAQDGFDSVMTLDTPGPDKEYLILKKDSTEYILHSLMRRVGIGAKKLFNDVTDRWTWLLSTGKTPSIPIVVQLIPEKYGNNTTF